MELYDVNSDGYLDCIGSNDTGHTIGLFNGTDWSIITGGNIAMNNATIGDYDLNGQFEMLTPMAGSTDGDDSTFTGSVIAVGLNGSGFNHASSSSKSMTPHTSPSNIALGDLDGDGVMEQIIAAGESSFGIFVGGWHTLIFDIENDSVNEVDISGYAGDGANGLDPIEWTDMHGVMQASIEDKLSSLPHNIDSYGCKIATITPSARSGGDGEIILYNLEVIYSVSFNVNLNPHASGNLSNALNQMMQAGVGSFSIILPFNSTETGTVTLKNLIAVYEEGAPQLERPPTPILTLVSAAQGHVEFIWQDSLEFGTTLVNFEVFRVNHGDQIDLVNDVLITVPLNFSVDGEASVGNTYDYAVRSIHSFGVTSNLSGILTVTVPYPDPPPMYSLTSCENCSFADTPLDEGNSLDFEWEIPSDGIENVVRYDIFVDSQEFNDVEGLEVAASTTDISAGLSKVAISGLNDGISYWATVVPVDQYGNFTNMVETLGPTVPFNNSMIGTFITLDVVGWKQNSDGVQIVTSNETLSITAQLNADGIAFGGKNLTLKINQENLTIERNGTTDSSGVWTAINNETWSSILGMEAHPTGILNVNISFIGDPEPEGPTQPIQAAYAETSLEAKIVGSLILTNQIETLKIL